MSINISFIVPDNEVNNAIELLTSHNYTNIKQEPILHDGYIHQQLYNYKYPEPKIIDLNNLLYIKITNPNLLDFVVNERVYDIEEIDEIYIPGLNNGNIEWYIDINTGIIANWINHFKIRGGIDLHNKFEYIFENFHYIGSDIPSFIDMHHHTSDKWTLININNQGYIAGWSKELFENEHKSFTK